MNDILQIKKADARKAYAQADESFKPVLETLFGKDALLPITDRIKAWKDVLDWHGETGADFDLRCKGMESDEIGYRMCKMWIAALNEGWKPDYTNSEPKYHVWMEYTAGSGFRFHFAADGIQYSAVGSRLVLKKEELAEHFGKYAVAEINKFFL